MATTTASDKPPLPRFKWLQQEPEAQYSGLLQNNVRWAERGKLCRHLCTAQRNRPISFRSKNEESRGVDSGICGSGCINITSLTCSSKVGMQMWVSSLKKWGLFRHRWVDTEGKKLHFPTLLGVPTNRITHGSIAEKNVSEKTSNSHSNLSPGPAEAKINFSSQSTADILVSVSGNCGWQPVMDGKQAQWNWWTVVILTRTNRTNLNVQIRATLTPGYTHTHIHAHPHDPDLLGHQICNNPLLKIIPSSTVVWAIFAKTVEASCFGGGEVSGRRD